MKSVRIIAVLVCVLSFPFVCHAEEEPPEPIKADVYLEKGVDIVLPDARKPFSFVDDSGKRVGYLVDLWSAWARHTGIETRIAYMDQQAALDSMAANATDIHGGLDYDEDNEEILDYADSVHSATSVLAIRKNGPVDCSTAMADGRIGIVDDPRVIGLARGKYPNADLVTFPDEEHAITALAQGALDGVAVGYPHLVAMDKKQPLIDDLTICRTLFYHEVYAAVQKHQTELLTLVNEGLSAIPADEMEQIESRWFLTAEQPKPEWLSAVLPAVAAAVFVVGAVLLWTVRRSRR